MYREMVEHEDTIKVIREEYTRKLEEHIGNNFVLYERDYSAIAELLVNCTTLQLRALLHCVDTKPGARIVPANPFDHAVVMRGSTYIGIERDGHTHT